MKLHVGLSAVICAALLAAPTLAKMRGPDPLTIYDHALIDQTDLAVALVSIKSVPNEAWTNGNPPRPVLKILKLMRGGELPLNMQAVWHPLPYDADWAGPEQKAILEAWQKVPLAAPRVESQWYVAGNMQDKIFNASPVLRYPADKTIYETLGPLAYESLKNLKTGDVKPIEEAAARAKRLAAWQERMKTSAVPKLVQEAEYIATATITAMNHSSRTIHFSIKEIIKAPTGKVLPTVLPLSGFATPTYAALYDYYKTPENEVPQLVVFAKEKIHPSGFKGHMVTFIPVDNKFGAQPASEVMLQQVGRQ